MTFQLENIMKRRNFLLWGSTPLSIQLLSACGGGDDADDWRKADLGDETLDEGLDPASLSRLPPPIEIDTSLLLERVQSDMMASVVLGDAPQVNVTVEFYSIDGVLLAKGVTDASGQVLLETQPSRLVIAKALTAIGTLYGARIYGDEETTLPIYVDVLQTLCINAASELSSYLNIQQYALNRYFDLPHETSILNVGHSYSLLDQRLVYKALVSSGKSLEEFKVELTEDLKVSALQDAHVNVSFASHALLDSIREGKGWSDEDVYNTVIDTVTQVVQAALPVPFSGPFLKMLFDGLKMKSEKDNSFAELKADLDLIKAKLDDIYLQIKADVVKQRLQEFSRYFSEFQTAYAISRDIGDVDLAHPNYEIIIRQKEKELREQLILLVRNKEVRHIREAMSKLLGTDEFAGTGLISACLDINRNNRFCSSVAQTRYRDILHHATFLVATAYKVYAAAILVEYQSRYPNAQDQDLSESTRDEIVTTLYDFEVIVNKIKSFDVQTLPHRVSVDVKQSLAWVGLCNDVEKFNDYFSSRHRTGWWWGNHETSGGVVYYSLADFSREGERELMGAAGDDGFDVRKYMLYSEDSPNGVPQDAIDFSEWRLATREEIEAAFFEEAKKNKMALDTYAISLNGLCPDTPFRRLDWDEQVNDFEGYSANDFGGYSPNTFLTFRYDWEKYMVRNGDMARIVARTEEKDRSNKVKMMDLQTFKIHNRSLKAQYCGDDDTFNTCKLPDPFKLAVFPTAAVTEETMRAVTPWLHFEDVMSAAKQQD